MKKLNQNLVQVITSVLFLTISMVAYGVPGANNPLPGAISDVCTKFNGKPLKRFAIAYIDVDENQGYDLTVDILIAEITDTYDDGLLGEGDTITTYAYPTSFIPCYDTTLGTCDSTSSFLTATHVLTRDWTHDHDSEVVSVGLHNDDISVRFTWRRGSINESFLTIFTDGNLIRPFIIRDDFASLTEDTILSVKYAPATPIKPVAMSKRLGPDDDSFIQVEITFP